MGVGVFVHLSAPPGVLRWMLLGLLATAVVQALGQHVGGAALGGFVGAVTAALVAAVVHRLPHGPPSLSVFLPSFWLLVPGSLGVVDRHAGGDGGREGFATATAAVAAGLAIALGVLVGSAAGNALAVRLGQRREGAAEDAEAALELGQRVRGALRPRVARPRRTWPRWPRRTSAGRRCRRLVPVSVATAAAIASWARLKWCTRRARRSGSRAIARLRRSRISGSSASSSADISSIQACRRSTTSPSVRLQVPLERAIDDFEALEEDRPPWTGSAW